MSYTIYEFADICGQLSSLAYKVKSTDDEISAQLADIKSTLILIRFERCPIGCLAALDIETKQLVISYRGTDNNISQFLIDAAIAFLGDERKRTAEFSSSMASMHYLGGFAGPALNILRENGGEEAGKELLQSFTFRAIMFAKRAIDISSPTSVIVTGHSLGGMYAQIVGKALGYDVLTFGAPGAEKFYQIATNDIDFYLSTPTSSSSVQALHISSAGDLVGIFGQHYGEHLVVPYVPLKGIPHYLEKLKEKCIQQSSDYLNGLRKQIKSPTIDETALQQAKEILKESKAKQSAFSMLLSMVSTTKQQEEVDNISKYLLVETFYNRLLETPCELSQYQLLFQNHSKAIDQLVSIPTSSALLKEANLAKLKDAHSIKTTLNAFHIQQGMLATDLQIAKVMGRDLDDDTTT